MGDKNFVYSKRDLVSISQTFINDDFTPKKLYRFN